MLQRCHLNAGAFVPMKWLWDNRNLIGGLEWTEEPEVLRFFFGRMKEIGYWQEELAEKFRKDFGDSL